MVNSITRGETGSFNTSATNVWCPGRELEIKMGLKKRLTKKKKSKNVKRIGKDDNLNFNRKIKRKLLLRLV